MDIIKINNLTKDYGNKKGIFNVNISIKKGEVFGFLGPNGAGKTTTIRNLMGFIRPDSGTCSILGMDCFKESEKIKEKLGYLAGEIAFFDDLTGIKLLNFLADMKGIKDKRKMNELIERFELDPRGKVKKMSKGMKQKIGIISAFMSNAEVFILDEPTSGLDPLMQNRFVDLVLEEKKKGKTILMSSHIFEEIEKTCDRTAIIRNGKIVAIEDMDSLSKKRNKTYIISLSDKNEVEKIKKDNFNIKNIDGLNVSISVKNDISEFLKNVSKYKISDMNIKTESLEEIFLHYYGKEKI
ncbi:MAG: ABC transporter ATP-binding protein [Clostridium sp.]|nr:ABC transporter ATP-binding protein [Clostridium sp.]